MAEATVQSVEEKTLPEEPKEEPELKKLMETARLKKALLWKNMVLRTIQNS